MFGWNGKDERRTQDGHWRQDLADILPRHPRRPETGRPDRDRTQLITAAEEGVLGLPRRHPRCGDPERSWPAGEGRERIYVFEPTGAIEDDPNLTDKNEARSRAGGMASTAVPENPTLSYRSREPLRVTGEVADWQGHSPERLTEMKDHLERLKAQGVEAID